MVYVTPTLELPSAEDTDPRALWPTTSQDLVNRLEELLSPAFCHGTVVAHPVPTTGTTLDWSLSGSGEFTEAGGIITYNGVERTFLVTIHGTVAAGAVTELASTVAWGAAPGSYDQTSEYSTGAGTAYTAHTHHLSMVVTLLPGDTIAVDASATTAGDFSGTIRIHSV